MNLRRGAGIIIVLALWQLASWSAAAQSGTFAVLFPGPLVVALEGVRLLGSGALVRHAAASLGRVLVGLGAGSLVGILLGYLMGTRSWARDLFEPVVELLRPIPPLAWIPLAILWLGIGLADQAFIIFLGCVFPILLNTYEGVRAIEPRYLEASRVLGADDSTTWRRVVVPATLPHVLTGLRVGAGVAWMCLVAAELQGVRTGYGLGYMMVVAQDVARADRIMVGMLSIGILGYLMNRGMRYLEGRFVPWR